MGRSKGMGQKKSSPRKNARRQVTTYEQAIGQPMRSIDHPRSDGESQSTIVTPSTAIAGVLNWLAAPQGTALLSALGLLVSLASFLTDVSFSRLSVLGPALFAFLVWAAWRNKRKIAASVLAVFCAMSLLLVVRAYSAPPIASFYYGGEVMYPSRLLPYGESVPLTDDPAQGSISDSIEPGDSEAFDVSCADQGIIHTGTRSTDLEWAQITSGQFQTLWVPMPFLNGIAYGTARTLLGCSSWQWRLQRWDIFGSS